LTAIGQRGNPAAENGAERSGEAGKHAAEAGEADGSSPDRTDGGGAGDSTNVWPDAAAEEIFLTEAGKQNAIPVPAHATDAMEEADGQNLPPLDELVKRIPASVREALDDLFRVKYTTVRRVPKKALKG
jgi:hypothetical protein